MPITSITLQLLVAIRSSYYLLNCFFSLLELVRDLMFTYP